MYISVYKLDIDESEVCQALIDTSIMHKEIQKMFDSSTKEHRVLHGVYDGYLIVKSDIKPVYDGMFEFVRTIDMSEKISKWKTGDTFNFMITTDPYVQGKAPGSRKKQYHYLPTEKARIDWLKRKFRNGGAEIITVKEISRENRLIGSKVNQKTNGDVRFTTWKYRGALKIIDLPKFIALYSEGMGSKKAYGNGMVVLS